MSKEEKLDDKDQKRVDWEKNQDIVREEVIRLINIEKKFPAMSLISRNTGLAYITIRRHIKVLKFEPMKNPLRVMNDDVLMNLIELSKTHPSAAKLWFQLMEDWQEKSKYDITTGGRALERTVDLSKLTLDELKQYRKLSSKLGA